MYMLCGFAWGVLPKRNRTPQSRQPCVSERWRRHTCLNQCVNVFSVGLVSIDLKRNWGWLTCTSRYGKIAVDGSREHWSAWKFAGGWRGDGFVGIHIPETAGGEKEWASSSSSSAAALAKRSWSLELALSIWFHFSHIICSQLKPFPRLLLLMRKKKDKKKKKGRAATCRAEEGCMFHSLELMTTWFREPSQGCC